MPNEMLNSINLWIDIDDLRERGFKDQVLPEQMLAVANYVAEYLRQMPCWGDAIDNAYAKVMTVPGDEEFSDDGDDDQNRTDWMDGTL